MNRNTMRYLLLAAVLFMLTGCTTPPVEHLTSPTVSDIFTQPTLTTEPTVPEPMIDSITNITSWELPEYSLDEVGHYVAYMGGEMHLPFSFTYHGSELSEYGMAIMLFLDGKLQPFQIGESETQYVHIIYPEETEGSQTLTLDIVFTPLTGKSGDVFDLSILTKQHVGCQWSQDSTMLSGYMSSITTRLKLMETPSETVVPDVQDRLLNWNCTYTDASHSEYEAWEGNSMAKLSSCMRIGGNGYTKDDSLFGNQYLFTVTPEAPMELTMELQNTSGVEYSVLLFVDHQPISIEPIFIDSTAGQKANLTVEVDMSAFEDQSRVYAVIVPRNYLATFGYTSEEVFDVTETEQFYLFSAHSWAEVMK